MGTSLLSTFEGRLFGAVATCALIWFCLSGSADTLSRVRISLAPHESAAAPAAVLATVKDSASAAKAVRALMPNLDQYLNAPAAAAGQSEAPQPEATTKRQRQVDYIERFASLAVMEQQKFGIPASITLAQGLLETDAGASDLSRKANNHFGMKCFSRTCARGHCMNFGDDTHKDFFLTFSSAWASYRAHSKLLTQGRYGSLRQQCGRDYRQWAHGLKAAGYATAPDYAAALINLIETFDLQRLDQPRG